MLNQSFFTTWLTFESKSHTIFPTRRCGRALYVPVLLQWYSGPTTLSERDKRHSTMSNTTLTGMPLKLVLSFSWAL